MLFREMLWIKAVPPSRTIRHVYFDGVYTGRPVCYCIGRRFVIHPVSLLEAKLTTQQYVRFPTGPTSRAISSRLSFAGLVSTFASPNAGTRQTLDRDRRAAVCMARAAIISPPLYVTTIPCGVGLLGWHGVMTRGVEGGDGVVDTVFLQTRPEMGVEWVSYEVLAARKLVPSRPTLQVHCRESLAGYGCFLRG